MSLVEADVYKILNEDKELLSLLDSIRGGKYDETGEFGNGIFIYDLPENYTKQEVAPFVRIEPVLEQEVAYYDNENAAEEQRVQVSFWTSYHTDSNDIKKRIDMLMKNNGLRQYDANRYKDPDIDLIMHYRRYRRFDWTI